MQEKPEHLRRFTAAIMKASRHFAENQDAWVEAMTKRRSDVDRKDAVSLWNNFKTAWAVNLDQSLGPGGETLSFSISQARWTRSPK